MTQISIESLLKKIEDLESRLEDSEQLVNAIRMGEVDAFAVTRDNRSEVYTLQSGDYAYRVLIEEFGEGAINVTEEGMIVYTNPYFCELLKSTYDQVIGASLLNFVDKDSHGKFKELFQKSFDKKSKGEINLNINDSIIPVYISLTSLRPNIATVGIIITDLSEKKKNEEVILDYQEDLERKNVELNKNNKELASFAYVASHDLQEPLRKIQTFASRLIDKEQRNISETGMDYFVRIQSAARRMQDLIQDLLAYSRTDTQKGNFERVDLTSILEDVKLELIEELEQRQAVIDYNTPCRVHVIPFQFRQLLYNLISNSIKFSRFDQAPHIIITSKLTTELDFGSHKKSGAKKYCQITVVDNGIGFDQQYHERIFELFQRLHGKTEYTGTGIGLAIVKKIVENHNGYIAASSEKNAGATFNIYIPESQ